MKLRKCIFTLALAFMACGCPTMKPLDRPQPLLIPGEYTNALSGIVFPEIVGSFIRAQITQFDRDGKDMGGRDNYNAPVSPIIMTVYVLPAPRVISMGSPPDVVASARNQVFKNYFEGAKRQIVAAHPDAKLVYDGKRTLDHEGESHTGLLAMYEFKFGFPYGQDDAHSSLLLFQQKDVLIKYRFTYPAKAAEELEPVITEFMSALQWR